MLCFFSYYVTLNALNHINDHSLRWFDWTFNEQAVFGTFEICLVFSGSSFELVFDCLVFVFHLQWLLTWLSTIFEIYCMALPTTRSWRALVRAAPSATAPNSSTASSPVSIHPPNLSFADQIAIHKLIHTLIGAHSAKSKISGSSIRFYLTRKIWLRGLKKKAPVWYFLFT